MEDSNQERTGRWNWNKRFHHSWPSFLHHPHDEKPKWGRANHPVNCSWLRTQHTTKWKRLFQTRCSPKRDRNFSKSMKTWNCFKHLCWNSRISRTKHIRTIDGWLLPISECSTSAWYWKSLVNHRCYHIDSSKSTRSPFKRPMTVNNSYWLQ